LIGLFVGLLAAAGAVAWLRGTAKPAAIHTQDLFLPVVDGPAHDQRILLDATEYVPAHTPAPAVIVSPGFGETKDSVDTQAHELAERGFVVLTYTPRGFGHSTGLIGLNSPDYEVADARQLVDWLATRREVTQDRPGDPRVGVTGGSYGGALSLMLAGVDKRVDAIAPVITYNDLSEALLPNEATTGPITATTPAASASGPGGVFKRSWAGILFAAGLTPGSAAVPGPGAATPCGRFVPEVCQAYQQLATTGQAGQPTVDLLKRDSPISVTSHITVPTLLVQGEQDTLFGLDQADATAQQITQAGGKVKVIWYNGGHDGGSPGPALRDQIAAWLAYQLMGQGTDPGTGFQYEVQGAIRAEDVPSVRTITAPAYPGLSGSRGTEERFVSLSGPADQQVVNPAGGNPAAVSGLPGFGSAAGAAADQLSSDIPGEFAAFTSPPLSAQLLVAGAPRITLRISSVPGQPNPGDAVLFVKVYDVAPGGQRTLPGAAVAPIRVGALPASGAPVAVTVTLPGVVAPVQSGHKLMLVVSTTDQSYANTTAPSVFQVSLADGAAGILSLPVVPGGAASTAIPVKQLIGIAVALILCGLAGLMASIKARRTGDIDPALADVPLSLTGVSKSYRGVHAVSSLSFQVGRGQVVGLLGPNGAGKTTTLRMMMGLVSPSHGEIRVFGHRVRPGAPVLSRIGSFVEGAGFLPHLSGLANLHLYWQATGRPLAQAGFAEALEIAGLGDAIHRRVGTYSHGMRQRLAIAQAMLGHPDLLVLDEPTNGLDPPQIRDMRDVLRRYAGTGASVLVSSHLLAEIEQTCTRVVVMHQGKLVAAGDVAEIVTGRGETVFRVDDPQRAAAVLRGLTTGMSVSGIDVSSGRLLAKLNGLPRAQAVDALVRAGVEVDQIMPHGRLEDAFLRLVGGLG